MSSTFEIPFIFAPSASTGIDPEGLAPLAYEVVEHGMSQRQFRNRKLIRPCIDLDDYKFEALIDWLELEIRTGRSTNFQTVQRHLEEVLGGRAWIESVGGASHHADTRFTARIQDPKRDQLLKIGPTLERVFGLAAPIRVGGMEIAVDIRPKSGALRDRLAMVVLLQRHFLTHRSECTDREDDARYVYELPSGGSSKPSRLIQAINGKAGSGAQSDQLVTDALVRERIRRKKSHRAPFLDSTLYFGREGGPAMVSIEHKTSNRRNPKKGTSELLAERDRRARIEVRLQGQALEQLGIRELGDVFGFGFEKLQKNFFSFSLPTIPTFGRGMERLDELAGAKRVRIFKNSGAHGIDRFEHAELEEFRQVAMDENKRARRRGEVSDTHVLAKQRAAIRYRRKSFEALNSKVRVALRTLARRMGAEKKRERRCDDEGFTLRMAA